MREVRQFFRPEFLNRLDDIVIFHPLGHEHLQGIMELMLDAEQELATQNNLDIVFTDAAAEWLLDQNKTLAYGARPLRRIIQRFVREKLADFILKGDVPDGATIAIDSDGDGLFFNID